MQIQRYMRYSAALFIIWISIHSMTIIFDGLSDNIAPSDVGVVLGNEVNSNQKPSNRLEARLQKSIELYREKMVPKIIVSGGIDKNGNNESKIMKEYLVRNGVPSSSIFSDENGNTTALTAKNVRAIMIENGFQSVIVVSQYYHITRIKLALKRLESARYSQHMQIFLK